MYNDNNKRRQAEILKECIELQKDVNDYTTKIMFILLTSGSAVSALIIKNSVKVESEGLIKSRKISG